MTFYIFFTVFGLGVVFPCKGQVKDGDRVILPPEGSAKVQWQFNVKDITKVLYRTWHFTSSDGTFDNEFLAWIIDDRIPEIKSKRLAGLEIEKPATLVLKNVNQSYDGSYTFSVAAGHRSFVSTVAIIIAEKPKVTASCSSINPVIEGDNFRCVCKGEGGNPAPASVTWYDSNGQPIGTGKGEKLLTINNVRKAKSGSYKCEAKTHEQAKNETFIQLIVKLNSTRTVHTRSTVASTVPPSTKMSQTSTPSTPICEEKTNSVVMFFVGAAVTLLMVLLILFVIQIYKRRCRPSKLPTSDLKVDAVEMENPTSPGSPKEHPTKASRNHQDDYETPTVSETLPNEEIHTQPDMNKQNREKTRNDITFQNVLRSDLEYAYPTLAETAPYECVQNSPASVYTELDTNQRHETNDNTYQKLLKYKPDCYTTKRC